MSKPESPNCVTIFGAGITGLTAAHELVERGFKVQVWEPVQDERFPERGLSVGGMARTQWAAVDWEFARDANSLQAPAQRWEERRARPIVHLPQTFEIFKPENDAMREKLYGQYGGKENVLEGDGKVYAMAAVGELGPLHPQDAAAEILATLQGQGSEISDLYIEVSRPAEAAAAERELSPEQRKARAEVRAFICRFLFVEDPLDPERALLRTKETKGEWGSFELGEASIEVKIRIPAAARHPERIVTCRLVYLDTPAEWADRHAKAAINLRVREHWLPGEHGYRFFPRFYHHLFDTMKRTPILERAEKPPLQVAQERAVGVNSPRDKQLVESGKTIFDNLRPTTRQGLAFRDHKPPRSVSRFAPASFEELRELMHASFASKREGGLDLNVRDVIKLELKFLQFLTSCDARRSALEEISYWDYIGAESMSEGVRSCLEHMPRALVAMDSRECDARTQLAVGCQLILDNLDDRGYRDLTLNGPTSSAWLDHWRLYLEAQGVEFIHGRLSEVERLGDGRPWPVVECYEPRYPLDEQGRPKLMRGYFLLALPISELRRLSGLELLGAMGRAVQEERGWLEQVRAPQPEALALLFAQHQGEPLAERLDADCRSMLGVQFYFLDDVSSIDGHMYYPDSEWGLSSISQPRFWQDRQDWEHGYRGLLSVDVGRFFHDDVHGLSEADVAREVWRQITEATRGGGSLLQEPAYWHIDQTFKPLPHERTLCWSHGSPLQLTLPERWKYRPGRLPPCGDAGRREISDGEGYDVENGFVMAGTFARTYTRLTCMEAANESARHAVNGILRDIGPDGEGLVRRAPCRIFPLESRESDDLVFFKELDAELHARGLEHFIDILELDSVVSYLVDHRVDLGQSPLQWLGNLTRLLHTLERFWRERGH